MAIRKNKNGTYTVDIYDYKGERLRETFNKKFEAEAFESKHLKIKRELRLVKADLKKLRVPIDKALDDFLLSKNNLSAKSLQKYRFHVGQIKLFSEKMKIIYVDDFTPDHGTMLYNELQKEKLDPTGNTQRIMKAEPKTINGFLSTLRAFFREEVVKRHISSSPVLHLKNIKPKKKRPEYFSEEELKSFFAQEMHITLRNAFLGLLHTGMRIGEMENLTWNDIDLKNRRIYIRSNETHQLKTYYSNRTIPMDNTLYNLLTKISQNKLSEVYPFCSIEGSRLRERKLLQYCKDIAGKAGIKRAYLHKFRHTYATLLVQKGVRIEKIQKLLGHSSITETMIYTHVEPDLLHKDVEKLDELDIGSQDTKNT